MPQFPVTDAQGIQDGLNYVLSGPSGTGQNFASFGSDQNADLTGNYRAPFTVDNFGTLPNFYIYVAPIPLATAEMLDGQTFKFTYATPLAQPAFQLGQPIYVSGVANSFYDGGYGPIGVVESTNNYVIARTSGTYTVVAASTGGTVSFDIMGVDNSTDCNAKVTVTSAQDRVILSAQLNNTISYVAGQPPPGIIYYTVAINRYIARPSDDPSNPTVVFLPDGKVISKTVTLDVSGGGAIPPQETLFINFIDQPGSSVPINSPLPYKGGFYWYILEIRFDNDTGGSQIVDSCLLGLRSFTAQVLKA